MKYHRILLLTRAALPAVTGNAVTAERWRRGLSALGHEVRVLAAAGLSGADVAAAIRSFGPDVLHAHHAYRSGVPATDGAPPDLPLVVSLAGTDVHVDLRSPERREEVARVCDRAGAIVFQGRELARRLGEELPRAAPKLAAVPKALVWLGDEPWDLRAAADCGPDDFVFFVPAGIRPVKGNLECLRALEAVHRRRPEVRAVFAGPRLDETYAAAFEREVERRRAFARRLPPIPPSRMRAAYEGVDAVVNGSFAEGGSNALLEALAAGRPVLASDVPGNRQVVGEGNGEGPAALWFPPEEPSGLTRQALRLLEDAGLRRALGRAGAERARRWPTLEEEARRLAGVYDAVLEGDLDRGDQYFPGRSRASGTAPT